MSKNILIAFLIGVVLGQAATQVRAQGNEITRADLFDAAALCGILGNSDHDPFGQMGLLSGFRGKQDFVDLSREYARRFK